MRRALVLVAVLLFAGAAFAQPAPPAPCLVAGTDCSSGSGLSGLTSGRVTLSTGATTVGDDAGLTGTGTGTGFKLGIGTDVFISRASAGTLLVEDGSGNARDVRARTVLAGDGSAADPSFRHSYSEQGFFARVNGAEGLAFSGAQYYDFSTATMGLYQNIKIGWGSGPLIPDLFVGWQAAATLRLGDTDAASPVAQTLQAQGSRGGTDTNVAGGNLTIRPGAGTGSATGSSIVFQTPSATTSGTTGQTQTTRLTLSEPAVIAAVPVRLKGYTVATLPAGTVGDMAYCTDLTAPTFMAVAVGGGAVVGKVFYDGTNWITQ